MTSVQPLSNAARPPEVTENNISFAIVSLDDHDHDGGGDDHDGANGHDDGNGDDDAARPPEVTEINISFSNSSNIRCEQN